MYRFLALARRMLTMFEGGTHKPLIKFKLASILDINRKYLIVGVMHPLVFVVIIFSVIEFTAALYRVTRVRASKIPFINHSIEYDKLFDAAVHSIIRYKYYKLHYYIISCICNFIIYLCIYFSVSPCNPQNYNK